MSNNTTARGEMTMDDWRRMESGREIPRENYCDQPYVVVTEDGNWLCVLTTGTGLESKPGQHVVASITGDQGLHWSDLIDIEPVGERMTSWVTAFVVPSGRVYAIYNYEATTESTPHGGRLCHRYSDDNGRTWSPERHRIPIRATRIDRENVTGGKEQFFWCIDKPVVTPRGVYFGIPKLHCGLPPSGGESWIIHSANILTTRNPDDIEWELLPEGDEGIHNPNLGDIQEEQNLEVLSDGALYMVLRTEIGVIAYTVSRDHGKSWSVPSPIRYPDGRPLKNPRACPRLFKTSDGRFLLWFHNNGFPGWGNSAVRNPVWISGGVETDCDIRWSQPEILLYSADPTVRGMSYPDFVEQDGRVWVTETEKVAARVHEIERSLLDGMWAEHDPVGPAAPAGVVLFSARVNSPGTSRPIPPLPRLSTGGFSLELMLEIDELLPLNTVITSYGVRGRGFKVLVAAEGALEFGMSDARQRLWLETLDGADPAANVASKREWMWRTDPGVVQAGKPLHVVFIVDGLAKVVSIVANGRLLDGADERIQGWSRLNPWLDEINDAGACTVGEGFGGRVSLVRLYDRYLRTAEAVACYRSNALGAALSAMDDAWQGDLR
jgi:hypothetical protein